MKEKSLITTTVFSALMAGLFFSYSCSVTLGLGKLDDIGYIKAMQSINREIQNPVFFLVFFGTPVLLIISTVMNFSKPLKKRFYLVLIATIIYIIGVFAITMFVNVPLNNMLEKLNVVSASDNLLRQQRSLFEDRWNNFNLVRTVSSLITIIFLIVSCMTKEGLQLNQR